MPEIRGSYSSLPLALKPINIGFEGHSAKNSVNDTIVEEEDNSSKAKNKKIRFLDKLKIDKKGKLSKSKIIEIHNHFLRIYKITIIKGL